MQDFKPHKGRSDPISYTCACSARNSGGVVLLYYRYWNNDPRLPDKHKARAAQPEHLAEWHRNLTSRLNLCGKIRIAQEGFNVTVGGTTAEIVEYMRACRDHWSFDGLSLETDEERRVFFKPSNGCACVFGPEVGATIGVFAEITPMGVEGYAPSDWGSIEALSPAEFHRKCHEEKSLLLDVRNHYESRIGYFVSPQTGEPALRPPIRRFSQFPQYLKHHEDFVKKGEPRQIMTYCTGGIRCEKGVRWMQEHLDRPPGEKIYTLSGGIAAYMAWMDEEISLGSKKSNDSLFRGRNYVFDARGSTGLNFPMEPVAKCHVCSAPTDRLGKCRSEGCHLVLVVCAACDEGDPRCCQSCQDMRSENPSAFQSNGSRAICTCEQAREEQIWGGKRVKPPRTQGWRKKKKMD